MQGIFLLFTETPSEATDMAEEPAMTGNSLKLAHPKSLNL